MPKKNIKRKHKYTVLLSEDELEAVRDLAERRGLCVADYIRQLIREMKGVI